MPKRGDYRYVNYDGVPVNVYDYRNKGGYVQYYDGKNWGDKRIEGGVYVGPSIAEQINAEANRTLEISQEDADRLNEKYGGGLDEGGVNVNINNDIASNIKQEASKQEATKQDTPKKENLNISFGPRIAPDISNELSNINRQSVPKRETKKDTPIITTNKNNTIAINNNTTATNNNLKNNNKPMANKRKRAIAPDGSTQVGYTQEEFNQRLKGYEMENQALNERRAQQEALRSQTIGNGDITRDQLFKDALNKFASNPDGFTAEQRTALYNAGKQLGYYNDTMLDNGVQKPAASQNTVEPTAAGNQVQTQPQSNDNVKQGGGSNFIWYV